MTMMGRDPDFVLPFNLQCEKALIGAVLVNNEAYYLVDGIVQPTDFYDDVHAEIWRSIAAVVGDGGKATPVTLKTDFEGQKVGELEVWQYMGHLAANAATVVNAPYYAETLRNLRLRREVMNAAREVIDHVANLPVEAAGAEITDALEARLMAFDLVSDRPSGIHDMAAVMEQTLTLAAKAYETEGGLAGLSTGFKALDKKLGGMQGGDLIILAGRPSMGKTSLATNIGRHCAKACLDSAMQHISAPVGFFSIEMPAGQIGIRLAAMDGGVSSERIRRGTIDRAEWNSLEFCAENNAKLPIYIDDSGNLTVGQLAARARRMKRQFDVGLVIVDYLQLLSGSEFRRSDSRVAEVTEITKKLKALAKELDIPVIALSQLSRQVEQRHDKRPQLSDLRESGSIEQDADVVMFVYREQYYLERSVPKEGTPEHNEWRESLDRCTGRAEVIIAKQRNGPIGTAMLRFDGTLTAFEDDDGEEFGYQDGGLI